MRQRVAVAFVSVLVLAIAAAAAAQPAIHTPYLDLVQQYRDGDADAAVEALAAWPADGLHRQAFADLDGHLHETFGGRVRGPERTPEIRKAQARGLAAARLRLLPAAAVLHVATARHVIGDDWTRAQQHVRIAREIVDWEQGWSLPEQFLPEQGVKGLHARLRRDVYLLIAWVLQERIKLEPLAAHLDDARDTLPDDPLVLLASGSAETQAAAPDIVRQLPAKMSRQIPVASVHRTLRQQRLKKAEEYFRAALERDGTLAEAHLRLGRVLYDREQWDAASVSLRRAVELANEPFLQYLGGLFQAALTARRGGPASARGAYNALVRRWPGCQSALLGLSEAYILAGEQTSALGALRPLWTAEGEAACEIDPWWLYELGQAWRIGPTLSALRPVIAVSDVPGGEDTRGKQRQ